MTKAKAKQQRTVTAGNNNDLDPALELFGIAAQAARSGCPVAVPDHLATAARALGGKAMNRTGDALEALIQPQVDGVLSENKSELWFPPRLEIGRKVEMRVIALVQRRRGSGLDVTHELVEWFSTPWVEQTEAQALADVKRMSMMHARDYACGLLTKSELPVFRVERRTTVTEDVSNYYRVDPASLHR